MLIAGRKRDHEFHLQQGIGLCLSYNFVGSNDRRYLEYFTLPQQLIAENEQNKAAENLRRTQTFDPTIDVSKELQKKKLKHLVHQKMPRQHVACQIHGVQRVTKPVTPCNSSFQREVLKSKVYSTPLYYTEITSKEPVHDRIIEDLSVHDLEQDYEDGYDDASCLFYDDDREMAKQLNCIQRPTSRMRFGMGTKRISSANLYKVSANSTPMASQPSIRPIVTPINIRPPQVSHSVITYKPYSRLYNHYEVK